MPLLVRQLSEVEERNREILREEKRKHQEVVQRVERERRTVREHFEIR